LHAHIIPNIVKISLKRVEMNFCPGSKNSIQVKDRKIWQNYQRIMSLFQSFIDKNGLMFHKYYVLNELQVFMRYKQLPNKGNNKITELRTILQRESQTS
jgi:hypothetical protein